MSTSTPSLGFSCSFCNYNTSNKKDYEKHKQTKKHMTNISSTNGNKIVPIKMFQCDFCNKKYKDRTGLWKHKKKCENEKKNNDISYSDKMIVGECDLLKYLIKENAELKSMLTKVLENGTIQNNI